MKQLNFSISDAAHEKLEKIKSEERLSNNSEAIEFLIEKVFEQLQTKKAKIEAIKLRIKGGELR